MKFRLLEGYILLEDESQKTAADLEAEFNAETNQNGSKDWRRLINNASSVEDKKSIWEKYLASYWDSNAEQIKRINEGHNAFFDECMEFGFDKESNPFIAFLKNHQTILNKLQAVKYGAIHNAFVSDYISAEDLRDKNDYNVLSSVNLYDKNVEEIEEYLRLQKVIVDNFEAGKVVDALKQVLKDKKTAIKSIMYINGSPFKGEQGDKISLKPLKIIYAEINKCFGSNENKEDKPKTKETSTEVKKAIEDLTKLLQKYNLSSLDSETFDNLIKTIAGEK